MVLGDSLGLWIIVGFHFLFPVQSSRLLSLFQVSFSLEFELSRSLLLDHIQVAMTASR